MQKIVESEGFKRLYQAWVFFPTINLTYGEWVHGYSCPIGNPCRSSRACRQQLEIWQKKNAKKIKQWNKQVEKSGRVGDDIRIISKVHQVWPLTEVSPWNTGMFASVGPDPFL